MYTVYCSRDVTELNMLVLQRLHFQTTKSPVGQFWNNSMAAESCEQYLEQSETFRLCSLVPFTDTIRARDTCIQDIMVMCDECPMCVVSFINNFM